MQKKYRRMLIMLVYILVVTSTIAYSALTSSLQLNAEAKLRTISDIRVTGISLSSANGGTLQYESSYDVNTITSGFVLPTTDSSITYKVTVTNNGTIDQTIYDILTQSSNNSGLYYEISGYNVRDVIGFKTVVEFYITYKTTTPSEEPINVVNKFNFKKVYHVTFEAKGGTSITDGIKYEGVDLDLSTFTSTKQGYILSGWTDEQDGTTVKYQTNGTYTLDRDLILYAVWEGNPNTSYSVNHYVHDLGTNTYTLDSTDNLTGTTDSTLTLASLKKTIPGYTYVDGYLTGGTTKPTEGAVTTTTILADGSRVINLYYRRNYLYVQYHVNGGQLAEQHSSWIRTSGDLITFGSANRYLNGVYGSKVGNVDGSTYSVSNVGLNNYNNSSYINIIKNGYIGKNTEEWNTKADGTGTSYYQDGSDYDANGFAGADLSIGDQVVTLYVNWVPVNYEITYDLQGGNIGEQCAYETGTCNFEGTKEICFGAEGSYICKTATNSIECNHTAFEGDPLRGVTKACYISNTNPSSYNIESSDITLNNPLKTGYTFTGWTGSNGNTPSTSVTISTGSTGAKGYVANYTANTTTLYLDPNGGIYNNTTSPTAKTMTFGTTNNNDVGVATRNGYTFNGWGNAANYLYFDNTGKNVATDNPTHWTAAYPNGTWRYTITSTMYANWTPIDYEIQYDLQGGTLSTQNPTTYNAETDTFTLNNPTQTGYTFTGWTGSNGNTPQTTVTITKGSYGDKAYIANWRANTYTVTADANGGSIPTTTGWTGTGTTATKSVTYDSPYGTLPTPTRDGYIFKGWNGKNILLTTKQSYTSNANTQTQHEIGDRPVYMEAGRTYYISYNIDNNSSSNTRSTPIIKLNGTNYYENIAVNNNLVAGRKIWEFTPTVSGDATIYYWLHTSDVDVTVSNFMISTTNNTVYEPYYVTSSTNVTQASNHTLTAIWDAPTFVAGRTFNAIIKYLSGDTDASYTTHNTSITSFRKYSGIPTTSTLNNARIVSTKDSYTPIYAWFDNGTIYYYSESTYIYFNADSTDMFQYLQNMTSADISDIKTNKVESMQGMFNYCSSLTSIDLSNFDTSNVTNMYATFGNCTSITSLDLSNFDTSKVTNMNSMFVYNQKLTSLDLSSFDMTKVTNTANMINYMTSLKSLKTPSTYPTDSSKKITLPKLMVDASGNEYTELDNTSPTETMLYTPATFLPGGEFNAKIKQLAGNQDATYETEDLNITSIVRSNNLTIMPTDDNVMSTSDSEYPIYAWFDSNNGTIYYYTEALNPYMNSNSGNMFRNLKNLTSLDLSEFDTKYTTYMHAMFYNCLKLSSLNISNFDTSNVINMGYMFGNCKKLVTLDLSNFDMSRVTSVEGMFNNFGNPSELQTLKTPKVYPTDGNIKMTLPKTLIDASGNEYTELNSSSPTNTMLYTPATFLPGQEFNAKIKQLAGDTGATHATVDSNITSIVRANSLPNGFAPTPANVVSTSDSYYPIYAWYDNGTIYYYTEYANPYMNTIPTAMFTRLSNVENIDLTSIDTSKVSSFYHMFAYDYNLPTLNLSNFNTDNATSMRYMFTYCSSISNLDLSGFNTHSVTDMYAMFYGCSNIDSIDLSNFDMSNVTNTSNMLTGMTSLESLKTPNTYPSEATIQMPKTLYDPSGNGWSVLDSSAPTETWLHKMVCKRATTLHTETCSQTSDSLYCSGAGYTVGGSKNTSTITYGSLGTNDSTLNSGDAFTCDVNGDGTFNETTERFYYVGDYYNTTTKEFETDTGVLIYYNNVSAGTPNNTTTSEYDTSGENWHGPVTAITQLPTTSQWTNVGLKNNTRAILSQGSTSTTPGGTLPSDFSYSGYSARLLTLQEINNSLNRTLSNVQYRLDDIAPYYFENTLYSSSSLQMRFWLETPAINDISALTIMTTPATAYVNGIYPGPVNSSNYGYGVRPAIEVNKNFLNKKVNAYLITYDTNGGSENTTQTVTVGDSLESLSVPTREGYTFAGWYTEASGGEEVTTATVPIATTTYYAHWTPINYNITYDLDGGKVETANPTTYNPDSNSITLNNPTKTGYTFAGWNGGKNLFNKDTTPYKSSHYIHGDGTEGSHGEFSIYQINVKPNTTYTITGNGGSINPGYVIYDSEGTRLAGENTNNRKVMTFTTPSSASYMRFSVVVSPSSYRYEKDIFQIEENSTSTSYEPYVSNETTLTIPSGSVGNRNYIANWTANTYTVTADANGGSIPSTNGWTGTGNTATKSVTYDSPYGTLPTPTRNGYTFKGWNGKNYYNYNNTKNISWDVTANSNGWITIDTSNNYLYYNYWTYNLDILEDTNYMIALEIKEATNLTGNLLLTSNEDGGINQFATNNIDYSTLLSNNTIIYTLKTSANINQDAGLRTFYYNRNRNTNEHLTFRISVLDVDNNITPSNFRYEPYYVTSSTNVTQDKNHTLKAKWEMNTYEITYDLQGGSLANSNPATYNVETQTFTLNNPTLTGQTFIGWTGSNGNTPEVNVTIPIGSYGDKAYVANFSPIYDPETRIRSLNTIGTSIADDDPDSNLRFIGSNPNNYVSFNGQKWRIIGVFDGKLKIIGDSIGNYSWDTSRNTVNNGYGVNQWGVSGTYTGADLMKLLNPGYESNEDLKCNTTVTVTDGIANCGDNTDSNYTTGLVNNSLYWNASSGKCYTSGNYNVTDCNFTSTGLKDTTSKNMIDDATWYLGSVNASQNIWAANMFTASFAYNFERGNLNGKQCSSGTYCTDTVDRTTTWQGKVGLLYPSDYIYATSGGSTYNRNTCLTVHAGNVSDNSVSNWNNTYTDCKNNDWLLQSSWTWSLSPRAHSSGSNNVFYVDTTGYVSNISAMYAVSVRPVVYLKSSIKLTSGDGSYNSPFNLIDTE